MLWEQISNHFNFKHYTFNLLKMNTNIDFCNISC